MIRLLGVSTTAFALLASAAHAETFCVQDPSCTGSARPTVQSAIDAAAGNGAGRDQIVIGPTPTPLAGGSIGAGNPVDLVGAGPQQTVLTAGSGTALTNNTPTTTIAHIGFDLPEGVAIGVRLQDGGTLSDFRVAGATPGQQTSVGVRAEHDATVEHGVVEGPEGAGSSGISTLPSGGSVVVRNVRASGAQGIQAGAGFTTLSNLHVTARNTGLRALSGSNADVTNAVVRLAGTPTPGEEAYGVLAINSTATIVSGHYLTIVGSGRTGSIGTWAVSTGSSGNPMIQLDNSVITGFGHARSADAVVGGSATVELNHSLWDPSHDSSSGAGSLGGANNVAGEPTFADVGGDFRLRHDSLGIDAGRPGPLGAGEPTTDLDGNARVADGDGDGTARRDVGAFEYGRRAPVVTVTADRPTARVGESVTFTAAASDADLGDTVTEPVWIFSDGARATGATVTHTFATAGRHTAAAGVSDSAGLGASASTPVEVEATPTPSAEPAPPRDLTPPGIGLGPKRLRASSAGIVSVPVRCAATDSEPCAGLAALTLRARSGKSKKLKAIGTVRARFSAAPGKKGSARLRLSRAKLRRLRKAGALKCLIAIAATDAAGNTRTLKAGVVVLAPKRGKRR
jgi:hypothetical protein